MVITNVHPLISEETVDQRLYLRPREVAELVGLSTQEIYRSIYAGELRAMRYRSRSWLISRADIDTWLTEQGRPNVA